MRKLRKIMAGALAFILIAGILFVANGLVGNPISKLMANKNVAKYIKETYPNMDLVVAKATYDFKSGRYGVYVESPKSIDTHFEVQLSSLGKVEYDSYEGDVVSNWNTWTRVGKEYRQMVEDVFESKDFPYESEIDFGDLKLKEADQSFGPIYGLELEDLELDKIYDIKELAKDSGQIVLYVQDDQLNSARASEILLHIKEIFDGKDVPFYAIDLVLEEPRVDGRTGHEESFSAGDFLYSDIYEDGLIGRLEKASDELAEYYKTQDAKMEKYK